MSDSVEIFCGCRDRPQIARWVDGVFTVSRSLGPSVKPVGDDFWIGDEVFTAEQFARFSGRGDMSPVCRKCKKAHDLLGLITKAQDAHQRKRDKLIV